MSGFAHTIRAVFVKDLLVELRGRQLLATTIMLGVLVAWIFRLATGGASGDTWLTAAPVTLIAVLFAAILTGEKASAVEQQNDCVSALLLAPVDAGDIYLAKLLVGVVVLCIFEAVTVPVIVVLFKVSIGSGWKRLILVLMLCNLGMSSLGVLLGCLVQPARAAGSLLSVLVMAALCPMMMPAISALSFLFGAGAVTSSSLGAVDGFNAAVGYIAAFDAIFVTVCWLLSGFVIGQ